MGKNTGRLAHRVIRAACAVALAGGGLFLGVTAAQADTGGSGGTIAAGSGNGGSGYDYRFWSVDHGDVSNTDAIAEMMAWPGWGAGNPTNRRNMINATCDVAYSNAIAAHGGSRADYRVVLVGGFLGTGAQGGKVWYNGSPARGMLNRAFDAAWPGLVNNLNAISVTGNPPLRPEPETPEEVAAYRQYVNGLAKQALGAADSSVVRICVVLKYDQPALPPPTYSLTIGTNIADEPTGAGESTTITDYVSTWNGGSGISESLSGTQTLYWDRDLDGVSDASVAKPISVHNSTGGQHPGATFSPADLGSPIWNLGAYWIDTTISQQGSMAAPATHAGQHDPAESFAITTAPAIEVVKFDVANGPQSGDRDEPGDPLRLAPNAETALSLPFTNTGDEPLTNLTFEDSTTAGSGSVAGIVFTSGQGDVTVNSATGHLMVNGSPLVLAPGETVQASGTLRGVVVDEPHTDLVTVTGTGLYSGETVSSRDPWNGAVERPAVSLEKWDTGSGFPAGDRDGAVDALQLPRSGDSDVAVETSLEFEFVNTGDVPLTQLVFTDTTTSGTGSVEDIVFTSGQGAVTVDPATGFLVRDGAALVLAPGESVQASGVLRGVGSEVDHENVATISGVSTVSGATVTAQDPWHGKVERPAVDVEKWDPASGDPASGDRDEPSEALILRADGASGTGAEQVIRFDYVNTGDVALTNVVVRDATTPGSGAVRDIAYVSDQGTLSVDPTTGILMVLAEGAAAPSLLVLAPGEAFSASGVLSGVLAGEDHRDVASIEAVSTLSGQRVTDEDAWHGKVEQPGIGVLKFDTASGAAAGDRNEPALAWTMGASTELGFILTNTGNVPLSNVTFHDSTTAGSGTVDLATLRFTSAQGEVVYDTATGLINLKAADGTLTPITLAPVETITATATLKDVQPGTTHTDVATVEGTSPIGTRVVDDDPWHGTRPATTSPVLARTGASAGLAASGAVALVALGAGAYLAARPQRRARRH